jgi:multidrug efflux system membrane fusion protein
MDTDMTRTAVAALALVAAAALAACSPDAAPAPNPAAEPPAVPVAAATEVSIETSATQIARIEAAERVELRARVSGPIEAVLFKEGDLVRAGQPLLRIDTRTFDAAALRAQAEYELAAAREALARSEAARAERLASEQAIAVEEAERRIAAHAEARARRDAAAAALKSAQLEREFAILRAPISGRIGRALVTTGNIVGAGPSTAPLATIVSAAPLHVHFDVADGAVIERLAGARSTAGWQARLLEADGQRELLRAPVDFADHSIDAATGTLRLRARIDAPAAARLMPGQFVRVQLASGAAQRALVVPDKAIGTDQGRRFVLVVGADGTVEYRPVQVGAQQLEQRIVTDGLKAGEQVIVSGLMRVRPGMAVRAQPAPAEAAAVQAPVAAKPSQS